MEDIMKHMTIKPNRSTLTRFREEKPWDYKKWQRSDPKPEPNQGFTIIEGLVTLVAISICVGFIALIVFGIKGCNHVMDKGVKNIANDVWEGSDTTTTNQ